MGQRVNQTDLIAATAVGLGIPVPRAKAIIDEFLEHTKTTLMKGNQVLLSGFMSLGVRKYRARVGRNPRTGGEVKVPAGRRLFMRASSSFKNVLNTKKITRKKKAAAKKTAAKRKPKKIITKRAPAKKKTAAKRKSTRKTTTRRRSR